MLPWARDPHNSGFLPGPLPFQILEEDEAGVSSERKGFSSYEFDYLACEIARAFSLKLL